MVACTRNVDDRQSLVQYSSAIVYVTDIESALARARELNARLLIVDVDALVSSPPGELAKCIERTHPNCVVVVRADAKPSLGLELWHFARRAAECRLSLRGYDDVRPWLGDVASSGPVCATFAILKLLDKNVPDELREEMAQLVGLLKRARMEETVSAALGRSSSSFRSRMAARRARFPGLPSFARMNAIVLATNLVWGRAKMGVQPKVGACDAGFKDTDACDDYLRYHFGKTARTLAQQGGYDYLIDCVARWFGSDGARRL